MDGIFGRRGSFAVYVSGDFYGEFASRKEAEVTYKAVRKSIREAFEA